MPRGKKPHTKAELLLRLGLLMCGVSCLGVVAFFAALGAWHMFEKERNATEAATEAKRQLAVLSAQETELQGQIHQLATPTGQEAALRSRFGVIKPGEGVIQIVENSSSSDASEASASDSWLKRVIDILWPW